MQCLRKRISKKKKSILSSKESPWEIIYLEVGVTRRNMPNELTQEAVNISSAAVPQPVSLWLVRAWFLLLKFYICVETNV